MEQESKKQELTKKEQKQKKQKTPKKPMVLSIVLMSLLAVGVVGVNVLLNFAKPVAGLVDSILEGKPSEDSLKEVTKTAQDVTLEEAREGFVLLKNDGSLPLTNVTKVNVFGRGSYYSTFAGTGSGSGSSTGNVSVYQGLENSGFELNPTLKTFYAENAIESKDMGLVGTDYSIYENEASELDDLMTDAKAYSNTAIYVISRIGGEGEDLPMDMEGYYGGEKGKSYLELNKAEEETLAKLEENFEKVIIVLNSTNAMELGFLDDDKINGALWTGCLGSTGANAIGEILKGKVNPSGRTVDTFAYAVESAPSYYSFGDYDYSNITYKNKSLFAGTGDASNETDDNYHYVDYVEGIYVGYRYYETAAKDGYIDYDETVQFPFGYGLSYTEFKQEIVDYDDQGTAITMKVRVTNNGDVAGQDVVQVYYTAPYTKGGIEKSEKVLIGFDKTASIEPNGYQDVTITFKKEEMASYDYKKTKATEGGYVLEKGDYKICLQKNSHELIQEKTYHVGEDIIYDDAHDGKRSSDTVEATNLFDDVSDGDNITYVSRNDWEETMPKERAASSKEATQAQKDVLNDEDLYLEDTTKASIKTKNNHLKLKDLQGVDYNDEKWDKLVEEVSLNDMKTLIGNGGWNNAKIDSIDKPKLVECDGPNGINNIMASIQGNPYTNESTLACSWNPSLATKLGSTMGKEALAYGISGLYGPATNIHRSPFSGRNYEYYSEDGFLSGKMCAYETKAINDEGVYTYVKHFALNDQEKNRDEGGLITWFNEQAAREIYLRGFELAVKEGATTGMMSSFNRLGLTPAAESKALLTDLLRGEWGFRGTVITDCVMACWTEDVNKSLLAGNDLQLTILGNLSITDKMTSTVSGVKALKQATKNILYTVANSKALDEHSRQMYTLEKVQIVNNIIMGLLFALYIFLRVRKTIRYKNYLKENNLEKK